MPRHDHGYLTMGCNQSIPEAVVHPMDMTDARTQVAHILKELNATHLNEYTLQAYTSMGMQDAQYSPNMTIEDKLNLDRLWRICETNPHLRHMTVGSLSNPDMVKEPPPVDELAKKAENNMIRVLKEHPELMEWFREYNPPHYMYNNHRNMILLSNLVDDDGHSGASFALCCRAVRNRLIKNEIF